MTARTTLDALADAATAVDHATEQLRQSRARRDHHLLRAHAAGHTRQELSEAGHLSQPGVQKILAAAGATNPALTRKPKAA
ncbi:hypothetical protein [Xylanimonas protaetiae]|uniref:Uncharacterized protein n=1 Tax=Xylanimonas protaetiae TaxID=2509457 RepID=A0A4P6F2G2_9MICO|nr:hypothetical protein [Xylanimonas protaetiae]QAY70020.1 hypothetical protein ET471_08220 [Xylanimonas protaetiae]